jgi:hypothetical protein
MTRSRCLMYAKELLSDTDTVHLTLTPLLLALLRFDNLEEEALFLLHLFEFFLCLIVHQLEFVLLCVRANLCSTARLHNGLNLLPIVTVLVKCYQKNIKILLIYIEFVIFIKLGGCLPTTALSDDDT